MSVKKKVTIYTDGACSGNPGPGGWAAILIFNSTEKEISGGDPETTNNRMELTAVTEALSILKEPCEVDIFTDSTYVASAFMNGWVYGWKKKNWKNGEDLRPNHDLWEKLLGQSHIHDLIFYVVKGHADCEYNNRCDKLAVAEWKKFKKTKEVEEYEEVSMDLPYISEEEKEKLSEIGETVLDKETVFKGKVFDIEIRKIRLPDGREGRREVLIHNGGAAVVAIDDDENVYVVDQYRNGPSGILTEIPAGKIEKGEDPKVCAVRELTEETGMIADEFSLLTEFYVSPGYDTEKIYIYLARGLSRGSKHTDPGEFVKVRRVPFKELLKDVTEGRIEDAKTQIGILLADKVIGHKRSGKK